MSTLHHFLPNSRRAALTLVLTMLGGLSASFMVVPAVHAADGNTTPTQCTELNHNGCTELSPTPPQDTVAVPPNIMLMLDDSGSMAWDVMPDYGFLSSTSDKALVNSSVNGLYYNPEQSYDPPPKADGSNYPNVAFDNAPVDGFDANSEKVDLTKYHGQDDSSGGNKDVPFSKSIYTDSYDASCPWYSNESKAHEGYCYFDDLRNGRKYEFKDNGVYYVYMCKSHDYDVVRSRWGGYKCKKGGSFFYYTTKDANGYYVDHYVAKNESDCTAAGLSSSVCTADPAVKQKVANWFSYYHTRSLMAKSALMASLNTMSANYRFGYGSIHDGIVSDVSPFGDGASGTQKAKFWNWLSKKSMSGGTPLRSALDDVGKYYETTDPWKTMAGDPNYDPEGKNDKILACRASYTILTTDGFWNGPNPSAVTKDAANKNGPTFTDADGNVVGYKAVPPFSGSGADAERGRRYHDDVASLADVAAYYWKNDLQPDTPNLVTATSEDPAFWQHMTTFTLGLGFAPTGIQPDGTSMKDIFAWAHNGDADKIANFSWPRILGGISGGGGTQSTVTDLAHAAVTGHGNFFSAKTPEDLKASLSKAIARINANNVPPTPSSVNVSVATVGALTFSTGYNTGNWSGTLQAVTLKSDGTIGDTVWDATAQLDGRGYSGRQVFTDTYSGDCTAPASGSSTSGSGGTTPPTITFKSGLVFAADSSGAMDCTEIAGLSTPAIAGGDDTLDNRINYLRGDRSNEGTTYRTREHVLGAIIHSQPVYVSYPSGNYYDIWPSDSPEAKAAKNGNSYSKFVTDHAKRPGTVYVGANDGMLHAFAAPAPQCTTGTSGKKTCDVGNGGMERWAFVPRAVYANLGNLTDAADFHYRPTVDASPVTRDVFFSEDDESGWHTILAGGVGLGGRGVYALDITRPRNFTVDDVLWEFDSDMTIDTSSCYASYGTCKASDLGYTVPQLNIGRLHDGHWVVLVPNGYFPDCTMPDTPTHEPEQGNKTRCKTIAAQAPKDADGKPYSALFVLDAQTGKVLAELKTPTDIGGVTSYGLGPAAMGDYNSDQISDVAYAGDLEGNLWRFDLSSPNPSNWTVTLAYKGKMDDGKQGVQPITTMPRLFPDPATNRFMVVFGTGKYLGTGDNTTDIPVQSVYGIRDELDASGNPVTATHDDLQKQDLKEETIKTGELAGATARTLTDNSVDSDKLGWYFDLKTTTTDGAGVWSDPGERVVVMPGAIYSTNTIVISTLIPSNNNYCDPSATGAIMFVSATNGGPGSGVSMLGGWPYVGVRVSHVRTSGTLPLVSAMGGGKVYLPGTHILLGAGNGGGSGSPPPLAGDTPVWRRRSWSMLNTQQ